MSRFKKAVRNKARLRMAIDGPSGSGKSMTALRLAFAFPGAKVAAIEAGENGGLTLYQGMAPDGVPFDFDVLELKGDYSPSKYTEAIQEAGAAGYDVLVIDSLSHAWSGEGGALDLKDKSGEGNSFTAWKNVTPMHNRMIDAILGSPCHVICTLRSKTEYVMEQNERGKMVPRKIGMAPIQRAGMEYEFTVYGSMDHSHILSVTKSRCPAAQDLVVAKPGAAFMGPILTWLETGEVVEQPAEARRVSSEQAKRIADSLTEMKVTPEGLAKSLAKYGVSSVSQLLVSQADEVEEKLKGAIANKKAKEANAAATNGETK